ncbi:acyl-CoA dehydrogenase family protein [Virgibacillus natechei]
MNEESQDFAKLDEFIELFVKPNAKEWDSKNDIPKTILEELGRRNLLGIPILKNYHGGGGKFNDVLQVISKIAKESGALANIVGVHTLSSFCCINEYGTEYQKENFLKDMALGKKLGTVAITETNAGSDVSSIDTVVIKNPTENGWILNGEKTFITNGNKSDIIIVLAKVREDGKDVGDASFIVNTKQKGFEVSEVIDSLGQRGSGLSRIKFNNLNIDEKSMIGKIGDGSKIMLKAIKYDRLVAAIAAISLAKRSLEIAEGHLNERKQFGRPMSKFQALRFEIAKMHTMIYASELMIADSLEELNENSNINTSSAKVFSTDTANYICNKSMHLLGSHSYYKNTVLERLINDVKGYAIAGGTSEIQNVIIAKEILK